VLELLYSKGPHPLQQIGDKILITSGSITYVINKLEQKGLLVRTFSQEDRRITFASLTPEGRKLLDDMFPAHVQLLAQVLGGLDEEEKRIAIGLLKKIGYFAQEFTD
jgi:MarR family 2-MHQ and catechol resistance regulon transcriptional repressor